MDPTGPPKTEVAATSTAAVVVVAAAEGDMQPKQLPQQPAVNSETETKAVLPEIIKPAIDENQITKVSTVINETTTKNATKCRGAKMECSICLDICVHPVRLPCKHIFCFLCVKGASSLCRRCPICRKCIPAEYFDNPILIERLTNSDIIQYNGAQWFYEGRNGWWLYDERTTEELNEAFKTGRPQCHLLIAGHLYIIDFVRMIQCRKNEPHRQRRIKRDDIKSTPTKGIAGIKINPPTPSLTSAASTSLCSTSPPTVTRTFPASADPAAHHLRLKPNRSEAEIRESEEEASDRRRNERTNERLDELAANFIRSLNLQGRDFQETYI